MILEPKEILSHSVPDDCPPVMTFLMSSSFGMMNFLCFSQKWLVSNSKANLCQIQKQIYVKSKSKSLTNPKVLPIITIGGDEDGVFVYITFGG